jgi:hypothetical protein
LTREELAQVLNIHPRSVKRHYLKACGKIIPGARGERYRWREVNEYIGAQRKPQEPVNRLPAGRPKILQKLPFDRHGIRDPNRHGL